MLSYLKSNLRDLANHYHAQYQGPDPQDRSLPRRNWRTIPRPRAGIASISTSFRADAETPGINYQLADLQLEHQELRRGGN